MKKSDRHFLSVIVPVYQQEKTIRQDLYSIYDTLEQIRYDYEIIVVIDGILADHSYREAKKLKLKKLKIIGYPNNRGKGFAIRYGMNQTKGDYIAFIDSGMEIDPNGLSMVLEHLEWYNADVIVASKHHPASQVKYPLYRKIISFGAWLFAKIFLDINIHDTQAGLKIFKKPVLNKVLPRLLVKNFAFDLEILAVAKRLGFKKIYEAPIKLTYNFNSLHLQGSFLKTVINTFIAALSIFYRLRILKYYDDNQKRRRYYDPELDMNINLG